MKKTILTISAIVMATSNLFAFVDASTSSSSTIITSKTTSGWEMDGKKISGAFPIGDKNILTKAHGGNLSPITAYSDGMGVKVVSSTSMLGSAINNSAYNKLVFKYGEAAKASGLSLADQILNGENKTVPSMQDIRMADKLKNNRIVEDGTSCDDKNPNTENDRYMNNICQGTLIDCNDNNPYTNDVLTDGICSNEVIITETLPDTTEINYRGNNKNYILNNGTIILNINSKNKNYNLSFNTLSAASIDIYSPGRVNDNDYVKVITDKGTIIFNVTTNASVYSNTTPYVVSITDDNNYNQNIEGQLERFNSAHKFTVKINNVDKDDNNIKIEIHADQSFTDEAIGYEVNSCQMKSI